MACTLQNNSKITIFGDSVSKGVYIENGKVYKIEHNAVSLVEDHFNVIINNMSVFGQTLKRVYDKGLIDSYLKTINPGDNNFVVLSLGGNDSDYDWGSVANNPLSEHNSKTDIKEFEFCLESLVKKILESKVGLAITNLFPIDSKRYFQNIITKSFSEEQILIFLNNDISNLARHQECFNDVIVRIANKYNVPIIDIRSRFLLDTGFLSKISLDGIHPNQEGQIEIAKLIIDEVEKLVNKNEPL